MRQKMVITKLLQCVTEVYYKVHQVLQSVSGITKWVRHYKVSQALQSVTDCYYKMHQVWQSVTDCYYKVHQVLQIVTVITKWDVTTPLNACFCFFNFVVNLG